MAVPRACLAHVQRIAIACPLPVEVFSALQRLFRGTVHPICPISAEHMPIACLKHQPNKAVRMVNSACAPARLNRFCADDTIEIFFKL